MNKIRSRKSYLLRRDIVLRRVATYQRANKEQYNRYTREYNHRLKLQAITHYSPNMQCQCAESNCWHFLACQVHDLRALTIDHIKGGGVKHLKSLGLRTGAQFYRWLKKQNWPEGYQVLCANCQLTKRFLKGENVVVKQIMVVEQ